MKLYLLQFNYSVDHEYDCSDILGIFDSMKKAEGKCNKEVIYIIIEETRIIAV